MSEAKRAWRYQLDNRFSRYVPALQGVEFESRWFKIEDGLLTIREGYAWDGCSPAYYLPLLGWISPPNGFKGIDGVPWAYYPSLVHDAFCQFRPNIAVDKSTVVELFKQMLIEYGFPKWAARLYGWVVYHFGPQDWCGFNGYVFSLDEHLQPNGAW